MTPTPNTTLYSVQLSRFVCLNFFSFLCSISYCSPDSHSAALFLIMLFHSDRSVLHDSARVEDGEAEVAPHRPWKEELPWAPFPSSLYRFHSIA